MTSLLTRPDTARTDAARPRPLVLIATLGGVLAALGPLVVLLAVGVIGWFVTDAGVHGAPRDGMRMGALAWLAGHGSGFTVMGARVTIVPLGVTAISVWSMWRLGHRVGDAVSGPRPRRRPDLRRRARLHRAHRDRDVLRRLRRGGRRGRHPRGRLHRRPVGAARAGLDDRDDGARRRPRDRGRVRPRRDLGGLPARRPCGPEPPWRAPCSAPSCWRLALVFLVALAVSFDDAATMTSQLHPSPSEAGLYALVNAAFVPNAALFTGSFLLGPGFAVGGATLVSPGAVVLGPLPGRAAARRAARRRHARRLGRRPDAAAAAGGRRRGLPDPARAAR